MAKYTLTPPDPDPIPTGFSPATYLHITTDSDDLILSMAPPAYRSGDAVMKSLISAWSEYLTVGSPLPVATIFEFDEYIKATYGASYVLRRIP